jgi:hypothetical protein
MLEHAGVTVRVFVWQSSKKRRTEHPDQAWCAYTSPPHDHLTQLLPTRAAALGAALEWIEYFANAEDEIFDNSIVKCMVCSKRIRGDYVAMDLTRFEGEDLLGFKFIEDPHDVRKTGGGVGVCLACDKKSAGPHFSEAAARHALS